MEPSERRNKKMSMTGDKVDGCSGQIPKNGVIGKENCG